LSCLAKADWPNKAAIDPADDDKQIFFNKDNKKPKKNKKPLAEGEKNPPQKAHKPNPRWEVHAQGNIPIPI